MTTVLMNDFKLQWSEIQDQALDAFSRVGSSGYLVLGPEVLAFEEKLSSYWKIQHAVGCANGLDAIEIGLRCLGIKSGQKVLTTPLSAFATTLAILRVGGVPVFTDVDSNGLLDLDLAETIFQKNPDIQFFVPVHLYGHPLNLSKLKKLKNKFNLKIVEDCAQSIGAESFGMTVGSVGQVAATSFYPTKNLGCYGDGGALLTNSKQIADLAKCLRDYGQTEKYLHSEFGLNSRLDEIQAALLKTALLPRLSKWTQHRIEIAKFYRSQISNPHLLLPPPPESSKSVWHLFPIIVKEFRENFVLHLKSQGISSGIHYPILIPDQPLFKASDKSTPLLYEASKELPQARLFATSEVSLPIHPYLTEEELKRVVLACNQWRK